MEGIACKSFNPQSLFTGLFLICRPTPLVAVGNPKGWKHEDYEDGELPRKVIESTLVQPNHNDELQIFDFVQLHTFILDSSVLCVIL